ncbi:Transcriptional adapter ada2 [Tulasnella sp. 408]|nr:Transcriptional adapter ada2 [Tulasnella sp. 408]
MTVTNNRKPSISNEPNQVDLEPGLLVECDSCGNNITHSVHIRCAAEECKITNIDLCPRCFCKGKEVGKHKAWHPYRVILQAIERKRGGAEKEKEKKAERDFINKHKPFARLQTASDYETFVEGLLYEVSLRKRIQELQEYRRMGITTLAEAEKYEKDKAQGIRVVPPLHSDDSGVRPRPTTLTLATSSSLQLLTAQEQLLCSQLRILPKPYLAIKEALLREYIKKGGKLRKRDARDLFKIDKDKTGKIYDFLNSTGAFKPVQHAAVAQQQAMAAQIAANLAMMVNGTGPGATQGPVGNTPANSAPTSQVLTVPPLMAPSVPDVVMHPASHHS